MFLPLYDGVKLVFLRRPLVTWAIVGLNFCIFAAESAGILGDSERIDLAFGFIPSVFFHYGALAKGLAIIPEPLTLVTSIFLHGGAMHIIGNMLFLWVFGDNVEDAMGSLRFLLFYLVSGIGASLTYAAFDPTSEAPLIGASGAIAGVIGAYLVFYPRVRVFGLALQYIPLRIRAIWCLGIWFAFQIVSALLAKEPEVAWWAHVGGFLLGAAMTPVMRRKEVPLFGPREA
jgi:membrane associated rhomboid family serine protease